MTSPVVSGVWKAIVTYSGTLANNLQDYSLIISGAKPMPPAPQFVDPDYMAFGGTPVSIVGSDFASGADVTFFRSGHPDVSRPFTVFLPLRFPAHRT